MSQVIEIREAKMATVRMSDSGKRRLEKLLPIPACLGCERELVEGEQVRCGLCTACYQAVLSAEAAGRVTRRELIRDGKMLPQAKPGPKPKNEFTRELSERR